MLLNAGGLLASIAVPLSELPQNVPKSTAVQLGIGIGPNAGGSVPHIALWDDNGNRIGQYMGNANGHLDEGTAWSISIAHTQTVPPNSEAQPAYLMLSMNESDAICIAYIYASGDSVQYSWFGDVGYSCGADWYPSSYKVRDSVSTPKCVWIDQDHSNGLRFQGLSLHMQDFSSTQARVDEYNENQDTFCKSKPRMNFWDTIWGNDLIPFFQPPLKYTPDGADADLSQVITSKRLRDVQPSRHFRRDNGNNMPGRLIISNIDTHSAKELCESHTSMGPDFVSTVEGVFCDMEVKEWWYLCSATLTTGCFDLSSQTMKGKAPRNTTVEARDEQTGRVIPNKAYVALTQWE